MPITTTYFSSFVELSAFLKILDRSGLFRSVKVYLINLHFEVSFTQNFTPAFCEHHYKAAVTKLKGHLYMISSHSFIIEQNSRLNMLKNLH